MKSIKYYVAVLAMLAAMGGVTAQQTWTSGGCTVSLIGSGTQLRVERSENGDGVMADYKNPTDVPWKNAMTDVTNIVVRPGVTTIGENAFYNCVTYTKVYLPESLVRVKKTAFNKSGNMDITLPLTVEFRGTLAQYCNIDFEWEDWNSMGHPVANRAESQYDNENYHLIIGGEEIKGDLVIPNGVTSIPNYAFMYCSHLTSVTLPNSVTHVGRYTFSYCNRLRRVTFGNSIESINSAFFECPVLADVYISTPPYYYASVFGNEFMPNFGTTWHVPCKWLNSYIQRLSYQFSVVGDYGCSELRDIPEGWTVTADGQPVDVDASGTALIEDGAAVVVTPTERDKPRVKSVSIVPAE